MRRILLLIALLSIAACDVVVEQPSAVARPGDRTGIGIDRTAFATVQAQVEPMAERECRNRTSEVNCDFLISIDPNRNLPPNAFQSVDKSGRPLIVFTQSMLAQLANRDELAFVMSHEAAHHIRNHLARQRQNAISGAIILGGLATLAGGTPADVANAQDLGATVGARGYSKEFELEADELGTIITHRSGYRPSVGVKFFDRLPDPGDRFLGTHPPNPARIQIVQATINRYGLN